MGDVYGSDGKPKNRRRLRPEIAKNGRSGRRVQFAFRTWQQKAGVDRLYPFHCPRHAAVTAVYRRSKDLFLAQRFARHVSPLTTTAYTHPSNEELWRGIRGLRC